MQRLPALCTFIVIGAITAGCYILTTPPARDCPIESLLLDEIPFPPGAVAGEVFSPLPRAAWESAGRAVYFDGGIANHHVYRYRTAGRATEEFRVGKEGRFSPRIGGPWEVPSDLAYHSPFADQYYLACGVEARIYMCKSVAQYEEYYVYFNAHMSPDGFTFQDLERVLLAIDERMAECLAKPLRGDSP